MNKSKRPENVHFDRKIVSIIDEDASSTTAMIVVAHLLASLGANCPENLMGRHLVDSDGTSRPPLSKYPIVVLASPRRDIAELAQQARQRQLLVIEFPREAYQLWHDDDLVASIATQHTHEIDYWGIALYSTPANVNKLTGRLPLFAPSS